MTRIAGVTLALFAATLSPAMATTWHEESVDDPILKGATCEIRAPSSYGSYVYHWPSKYDQVFWPSTEPSGIGFCRESGFATFIGDFDGIDENQQRQIADYLAANYSRGEKEPDLPGKLKLLEGCYALRNLSVVRQIHLLRSLAYQYEEHGDQAAADSRRRKALEQIRVALSGELKDTQRLEYLFVAAAYEREFGEAVAAEAHERQLHDAMAELKGEDLKDYIAYLKELVGDLSRIEPGGKLAPPPMPRNAESNPDS